MLLAHRLSAGDEASKSADSDFQKTFEQYTTVRKEHVERILDAGNRGGDASRDLNIVAEYTMYAFFWIMCKPSPSWSHKAPVSMLILKQ